MEDNQEDIPKWQMYDECNSCEAIYLINNRNAHLFVFNRQPEVNRLKTNCTYCGHIALFFLTETKADIAIQGGVNTYVENGYAPKTVYDGWLAAMGIELIKEHELTPRQEAYVAQQEAWAEYELTNNLFNFNNKNEPA